MTVHEKINLRSHFNVEQRKFRARVGNAPRPAFISIKSFILYQNNPYFYELVAVKKNPEKKTNPEVFKSKF